MEETSLSRNSIETYVRIRSDFANLLRYKYRVHSMKLQHVGIFSLIIIAILIVPLMNNANALGSVCNLAGANSTEVKQCVKGFLEYQKMNHSTDSQMQQVIDSNRDSIRHTQKLQDPNETQTWVESKGTIARQQQAMDVINRDWYNVYTNQNKHEINLQFKLWKTYDHNIVPVPATCPKWHDCIITPVPVNSTIIPLKPEFANHTSGVINNPSPVANWLDLQKWFEEKTQTKK